MTARDRIEMLAPVVAQFPEMAGWGSVDALLAAVQKELGTEDALEQTWTAPTVILHIVSANTAMAGMQSLVRGLILGSENWVKLPQIGLPRLEEMIDQLPEKLRAQVLTSSELESGWLDKADAVVVFGSDATVENFRKQVAPPRIFAGYGHRWSGAVIFEDRGFASVEGITRDSALYDQMGCLSAQIVWLGPAIDPVEYGRRLADSLACFVTKNPVAVLGPEDRRSVAGWRLSREWDAAANAGRTWFSPGEPVWGVVVGRIGSQPTLSCLHRHVSVHSFSEIPDLGPLSDSVSTLGVWPDDFRHRESLAGLGASRICPVGMMQFPGPDWCQDGVPALARLARRLNAS